MFSKHRSSIQRPATPPSMNNSSSNLTKERSSNLQRSNSGNESVRRRFWNFLRFTSNRRSSAVRFSRQRDGTSCSNGRAAPSNSTIHENLTTENIIRDELNEPISTGTTVEHVVKIYPSSSIPSTGSTTNPIDSDPSSLHTCVLCCQEYPLDQFERFTVCSHSYCRTCLKSYLKLEISEGRVTLNCPETECPERIHPCDISRILSKSPDLIEKYEQFMVRRVLQSIADTRWCPAPDCGFAVIASGHASCPEIPCLRPGCNTSFCYHCKSVWHPNKTCEDAAKEKTSSRLLSGSFAGLTSSQTRDEIKQCPRCQASILKMDDGSCNHMTCPICEAEFCWLCGREISDLHYLSPSGCTFWGKKQWSRKKVILWQVATLIGAPVIIALIAGVAVPAVIISVPIWTGRKIFKKFNKPSHRKEKRNLLVALGVLGSVIVSPIIAALAVGIGVPILLAYVYGVIPISLCRTGGCGLGTRHERSESEGADIENILPFSLREVPLARVILNDNPPATTHPNIGHDSRVVSNSIVHLIEDRTQENLQIIPDTVANAHRVEVQVEVSDQKNFDIESITISEKSSKTMDSLKALAGSIKDACLVPGMENASASSTDLHGRKASVLSSASDSHRANSPISEKTVSFYDERQRIQPQLSTDRY